MVSATICSLLLACSKDGPNVFVEPQANSTTSSALSEAQALAYASLFSLPADNAGRPEELRSAKEKVVSHVDYYIEGKDTLLYAVNYAEDAGFVLIGGDNSAFPIIAHADKGSLHFRDIDQTSPFYATLQGYASSIKSRLKNPRSIQTEYYEHWKDLGNPDYQYEITATNEAPEIDSKGLRGRRDYSSGKSSIYPYTGTMLNGWSQSGAFQTSAKNGALIGCPSVAIAMLLYDCAHRVGGVNIKTIPYFDYSHGYANETSNSGKEVSKLMRQIADSIPNFDWGKSLNSNSGAHPQDILIGLKKLGFYNAQLVPFNIDLLYNNLSYQRDNGRSETRGVLLGAIRNDLQRGHIWFLRWLL